MTWQLALSVVSLETYYKRNSRQPYGRPLPWNQSATSASRRQSNLFSTPTLPQLSSRLAARVFVLPSFMRSPVSVPNVAILGTLVVLVPSLLEVTPCGDTHDHPDCPAEHLWPSNCGKRHASASLNCPRCKAEKDIYQSKVTNSLDYQTARRGVLTAKKTDQHKSPKEIPDMPDLRNETDFRALTNRHTGLPPQERVPTGSSQKLVTDRPTDHNSAIQAASVLC